MNRLRVWGPAVVWAAVLFLLSAWSGSSLLALPPLNDKLVHACLYTVLGLTLGYGWARVPRRVPHVVLVAIGALYAATDEWHQIYVPGRVPDVNDWFADLVGLLLGYGVAVVLLKGRRDGDDVGSEKSEMNGKA